VQIRYYERRGTRFTCADCGWTGLGSELEQGEVFAEIVEWDCPHCGRKVAFAQFPDLDETRRAAEGGNRDAQAALEDWPRNR